MPRAAGLAVAVTVDCIPPPSLLAQSCGHGAATAAAYPRVRGERGRLFPKQGPTDLSLLLVGAAAAVVAAATPRTAHAASGGVMGGRDTSPSPSSYSSSSSSSSSSSPSVRHYHYYPPSPTRSSSPPTPAAHTTSCPICPYVLLAAAVGITIIFLCTLASNQKTTVVKLQVALQALAKTMQKDLNTIAAKVDTTKTASLQIHVNGDDMFLEPSERLLVLFSLIVDEIDSWEEHFDKISIEERSKTDEETLFNVEGIKISKKYSKNPESCRKEYIVLTIILAAEGKLKFPQIRSADDLRLVLGMLNGIHASEIKGVQILWTPQEEDDALSEERLLKDYPYLRPLKQVLIGESKQLLLGESKFKQILFGESEEKQLLLGEPKEPSVQEDPNNTKG
ncbi:hypothetical protein OsJ_25846 [Oryza sativa Japonica Group]|uniref:Uncharacterized protein n=1 Tax=Oryza sativa subsp. japonica TaxID=39947 RepID=A3BP43_ORYSJ|nr:hypothetical protein OsJ_25846 [Oryza sativa Japonica Group]